MFQTEHQYKKQTHERSRAATGDLWGAWSAWTDYGTFRWESPSFTEEGDHDGNPNDDSTTYDRDYRYVATGQTRQVKIGTKPCDTTTTTVPATTTTVPATTTTVPATTTTVAPSTSSTVASTTTTVAPSTSSTVAPSTSSTVASSTSSTVASTTTTVPVVVVLPQIAAPPAVVPADPAVPAGQTSGPQTLPATGSNTVTGAVVGGILLALGGGALLAGRRKPNLAD